MQYNKFYPLKKSVIPFPQTAHFENENLGLKFTPFKNSFVHTTMPSIMVATIKQTITVLFMAILLRNCIYFKTLLAPNPDLYSTLK